MKKSYRRLSDQSDEKARFDRALRLRDRGELEEAARILSGIAKRHPYSAATFGILGGVYGELELYHKAVECYRNAVKINPRSALATRGLFNNLWSLGEEEEALALLVKFTDLTKSDEFNDLIETIRQHRSNEDGNEI